MRFLARVCSTVLLTSAGLVTSPAPAAATTFTVNTAADAPDAAQGDGACATAAAQCSLRAAVQEANAMVGPDLIVLPGGEYHIAGTGDDDAAIGDLDIGGGDLTIDGSGALNTVIDADRNDRIFDILPGVAATLRHLTVVDGFSPGNHGGGILNRGTLTLVSAVVRDSDAGQSGGGIQSAGGSSLTIDRSTISGNHSLDGNGGGVHIDAMTPLMITNSTISSNSAAVNGGGIYDSAGGSVSISDATIAGNRADDDAMLGGDGGGVSTVGGSTLTLRRTVVAGNSDASPGNEAPDCSGAVTSGGSNLIGSDAGCTYAADPTDKVGMSPLLGPLADNGGHTQTHALLPGSPAIDSVSGACEASDQRGVPRPQSAGCDIGAYELALCGGAAVNRLAAANVPFAGTGGPDVVLGTSGNDSIDVGSGDDKVCAGEGDDQLTGGEGNDALDGGAGTDRVVAVGNVDFILTPALLIGLGTDSLTGIEQAALTGGAGNNLLDASGFLGSVVLDGGDGQDGLFGGRGNDAMDGGSGVDHVLAEGNANFSLSNSSLAGEGTDLLVHIETAVIFGGPSGNMIDASASSSIDLFAGGGGGADTILGGSSEFGDFLLGEGGKDVVRGGGGPDLLIGGRGKDKLAGQTGSDFVFGDAGDDRLTGGAGKDRLMGGPGQDFMDGGPGRDVCNGGKQRDRARRCERVRKL
jgi:CSLREA domain-containing protein